jgi:hypothetical protein
MSIFYNTMSPVKQTFKNKQYNPPSQKEPIQVTDTTSDDLLSIHYKMFQEQGQL